MGSLLSLICDGTIIHQDCCATYSTSNATPCSPLFFRGVSHSFHVDLCPRVTNARLRNSRVLQVVLCHSLLSLAAATSTFYFGYHLFKLLMLLSLSSSSLPITHRFWQQKGATVVRTEDGIGIDVINTRRRKDAQYCNELPVSMSSQRCVLMTAIPIPNSHSWC